MLKNTGSLYLHCDPTMSHYLKLLLDAIFGSAHFRNEIVWGYRTGGNAKRHFTRKHDTIFFYTKSHHYTFHPQYYRSYQKYNYNEKYPELWDEEEKRWYHQALTRDVWEDINPLGTRGKARTGYPTQKPSTLLERIILASSHEGDVVLDPFCGCATTCVAAEKLGRQWIGIEVSKRAFEMVKDRLQEALEPPPKHYADILYREDVPQRTDLAQVKHIKHEIKHLLFGRQAYAMTATSTSITAASPSTTSCRSTREITTMKKTCYCSVDIATTSRVVAICCHLKEQLKSKEIIG